MEFILGVVKSQLSPFSWKTILVLVLAVGALFFSFRMFGKFNTAPEAVVEPVQQMAPPADTYVQPEYPQEEVQQETTDSAEQTESEAVTSE